MPVKEWESRKYLEQVTAGNFSNTTDWISQKQSIKKVYLEVRKHTVKQRELRKLKSSLSLMARDV